MKGKIGDEVRLMHIMDCIEEISAAVQGQTFESFYKNHVLRIAVVKWLEIIGEASSRISRETKDKYNNIEWMALVDLRNFVVHEYFEIGYEAIWQAATILIQDLKTKLTAINPNQNDNFLTN